MARHQFLAFDFGAESGRAILGTLDRSSGAGRLSLAEAHRFANPHGTMNGVLQWDVLKQWDEIKTGLRKSTALLGGVALDGIGVDTWGVDFGLLGADGQLLGNPVCYRDVRTDGAMERAFASVGKREIFESTGIASLQFNTLFQLLAAKRAGSSQLAAAKTLLFMPDLFNYLLTGAARAEFSIASTGALLDARTRHWATPLLKQLGLPAHLLPPIVATGTVLGPLLDEICKSTGARSAPVIATAGHDTASAVVAVPAQGQSWAYLSSGTWSLMGVELPAPRIDDAAFARNYTNEGGYGGTTRFLKNIMGLWLVQECRRDFERQGRTYDYATLTRMAADAPPSPSTIDVNDARLLAPGNMPAKIAAVCRETNQSSPENDAAMIRLCLDSLAAEYRRTFEGLEATLSTPLDVLHIVGGGSQNELLNQLTADAIGKPVIAGPVEATAIGNVLVQAMAVGAVGSLAEARAIVRASFATTRYEPRL